MAVQNKKYVSIPSIELKNKTLEWNSFQKIKEKTLLYNPSITKQIDLLKKILEPMFEIYDEEDDTNWNLLELDSDEAKKEEE